MLNILAVVGIENAGDVGGPRNTERPGPWSGDLPAITDMFVNPHLRRNEHGGIKYGKDVRDENPVKICGC